MICLLNTLIHLLISLSSVPRHPLLSKWLHCLPRSHAKNLRIIHNSLFTILHIQFISKFYWLFLLITSCLIFLDFPPSISITSALEYQLSSGVQKEITNDFLLFPSYSTTITILTLYIFRAVLGSWQN